MWVDMEQTQDDDTVEEEAIIAALLAGVRPPEASDPPPLPQHNVKQAEDPKAALEAARDRLVLDAACGSQAWTLVESCQEEDYLEQQPSGAWAACYSVVLSLQRTGDGGHMHDETGSGHVSKAVSADAARQQALAKANACARKRLAKRFAVALGAQVLGAIERAAYKEATGQELANVKPQPYHNARRPRLR